MNWEAWLVGLTVVAVLAALIRDMPSDAVMVAAIAFLVGVGTISGSDRLLSAGEAVAGLGNPGLVTIAVLFIVVAGLVHTGAISRVVDPFLGMPRSIREAQLKILTPVMLLSAVLNNTPVVAMFMPVVEDVSKRTGIAGSKLYMPMAFAATFGGVWTLIGTSTNLVVNGLLIDATGQGLGLFDLAWVGVPASLVAFVFLLLSSDRLLPDRKPAIDSTDDPRQYTVELMVQHDGPLVGKSIEEAGLRHLPGLYLIEIEREQQRLTAVASWQRLQSNDHLVFVGVLDSVIDLQKMHGLVRAINEIQHDSKHETKGAPRRHLIEAVVSQRCPLIGQTLRDSKFRTQYQAAVVAVARGDERVSGKLGDVVLRSGDTLLLEADEDFISRQRNSKDFFLVSGVDRDHAIQHDRAWISLSIMVLMIGTVTLGGIDLLSASLVAAT